MTLKNTDKFTVTVKNRQTNGTDTEYITETGIGSMRSSEGKYYIMYKTDTATVMIKLEKNTANVKRTGDTKSEMNYVCGKTTQILYNTPYGKMEMDLFTKSLKYTLDDLGGVINLRYSLCGIENDMEIIIN